MRRKDEPHCCAGDAGSLGGRCKNVNGNDRLIGGEGDDRLVGGDGGDTLTGGEGDDIFSFVNFTESQAILGSFDVITDWGTGNNQIDVSAIDADINNADDTNDSFTFVSTPQSDAAPNSITWSHAQAEIDGALQDVTVVQGDTTGDTTPDLYVFLLGHHDLSDDDFIGVTPSV